MSTTATSFPCSSATDQRPGDLHRHDPQVRVERRTLDRLVGLPFAHRERVADHARARLHREDLRAQLQVELGQQVEGDHARAREILLEDVAVDDRHAVRDAGALGVALRERGHPRVVLDAHRARAELGRGRDRDAAVARAEVRDEIVRAGLCSAQHRGHHGLGRPEPHDVLADLARLRRVDVVAVRLDGLREGEAREARERDGKYQRTSAHHFLFARITSISSMMRFMRAAIAL
jgi:hypothetical protein